MSHLINKLLGRDDESASHSHSSESKHETHTSVQSKRIRRENQTLLTVFVSLGKPVVEGRTVQHEGVNIKSTVSSDVSSTVSMANQQKLNDLVSKLGRIESNERSP